MKLNRLVLLLMVVCGLVWSGYNFWLAAQTWKHYLSWTDQLTDNNNWLLPVNRQVEQVVRSHTYEGTVVSVDRAKDWWEVVLLHPSTQQHQRYILPNQVADSLMIQLLSVTDQQSGLVKDLSSAVPSSVLFTELYPGREVLLTVDQLKTVTSTTSYISGITLIDYD